AEDGIRDDLVTGVQTCALPISEAGYALVLISNQPAYAKGKTELRALWLAHKRFVELLASEGVRLDAVFYSYGHPDGVMPHFSGRSEERRVGKGRRHMGGLGGGR